MPSLPSQPSLDTRLPGTAEIDRPSGAQALFHQVSLQCARLITRQYSTSFSLGISQLAPQYRPAIYGIYGFVRYADEIVDTFHGHDKARLLEAFTRDTWLAIREGLSLNPVLDAYQTVVNQYNIPDELTEAFLHSMDMDLRPQSYDKSLYTTYIYGSAEVVGLMCLCVFTDGDVGRYEALKPQARALGAAFQKVNFLRDIRSDAEDRGRVYFPHLDLSEFSQQSKEAIEADIAADFAYALPGIKALPAGCGVGVYLAYVYYSRLFQKIQKAPPGVLLQQRIRVSNAEKLWLWALSRIHFRLGLVVKRF